MSQPSVTIAATPDAETHIVRVTLADRMRHFEVSATRLKDRLVAVLISEFGMTQDDAHAHAERSIADAQTGADVESIRAEKASDYDRLAAELGTAQKRIADLQEANAKLDLAARAVPELQGALADVKAENAQLHAQIEQLTAAPPASEQSAC